MINKKEFDVLLKEISQIESKITELKIQNYFEEADKFNLRLDEIKEKAKEIVLDAENKSTGFDELSKEILIKLIVLKSDIDYFFLRVFNVIEDAEEGKINSEIVEKIRVFWNTIENELVEWNQGVHNPIEEAEYNKKVSKAVIDVLIYQIEAESILDLSKAIAYSKREDLIEAIKLILFDSAKDINIEKDKQKLIEMAKSLSSRDLYDYKLWQEILKIKNVKSLNNHIEIIGSLSEKPDDEISFIKNSNEKNKGTELDVKSDGSVLGDLRYWFKSILEKNHHKKLGLKWKTASGPAFKCELKEETKYYMKYLDLNTVTNVKNLTVASNGISKFNYDDQSLWEELESITFLDKSSTAQVRTSAEDKYNSIGKGVFANSTKLKNVSFGKIEMIGQNAFENCTELEELVFPSDLISIEKDAFLGCTNLKKVVFSGSLRVFILDRPQNILNCFKNTSIEELVFNSLGSAEAFGITDCENLKDVTITNLGGIQIPLKKCRYRLGRQEGIVLFLSERSLSLWKRKNNNVRFFEIID